jgi:DNA-binding transcriptional regulator YiaG
MRKKPLRLASPEYRELEQIRAELGMSREGFAAALGVPLSTYWQYKGRNVPKPLLVSARYLRQLRLGK